MPRLLGLAVVVVTSCFAIRADAVDVEIVSRHVGAKNYCAWPNITQLRDGTLAAVVFNQPSHGRLEGEVECLTSRDGATWTKAGVPIVHEPMTNRMNVACGLNGRGDLIVLCSGWTLKPGDDPNGLRVLNEIQRTASARSNDGGRTWSTTRDALPAPPAGWTEYVPFGDIQSADDGSLRVTAYARQFEPKQVDVWMFRSDDDGATWREWSHMARDHGETTILNLGQGRWLAAARRQLNGTPTDLLRSDDDGRTWTTALEQLGDPDQHPADFLRLADGRLLVTLGVRNAGKFGVCARMSDDGGATWSERFAVVDDCASRDCGYPANVQLADGAIVTGFYADGTPQHKGYQFATVVWKLPRNATK